MSYEIQNDCVGCPQGCGNCGRDRDYKIYFCDKCGVETSELYVYEKQEMCWECYKDQFNQMICDDCDDTLCAECGCESEILYLYEGEWVCEDCLKNMAERADDV